MDGHTVMPMSEAAKLGDFFVTVTGCSDVIGKEHFDMMKDGAILCNAGHFDVEVNVKSLSDIAVSQTPVRNNIMGYTLQNGKRINVLAEGRLVNLAAGDGHPAEIMDISFSLQTLCVKYLLENYKQLPNKVIDVPAEIDKRIAKLKLQTLGIEIDELTDEQYTYLYGAAE